MSLKALDVDTAAAWHLLLDTAPLGFALACPGASCEVWFAVASVAQRVPPPAPADAALLPARASPVRRVQSTQDDN